jgi:aryl-alcohol dehydrogenase-like predicted oxidoreductase
MKTRRLGAGGLEVSAIGLGHSMGADDFSAAGRAQFDRLIARALELGVTLFDTSDAYWKGLHEEWLGTALRAALGSTLAVGGRAVVASKFGNITLPDGAKATDGRPEYAIACCEASLKRLGTDCIDLYYLHRVDPKVPIEDTIGAMSRLVQQGKVRHLGICEAGVATLERAHQVHPLAALQTEYSLWCRDAETEGLAACRRLGIGFVGYSPLGRGLLGGTIRSYDDLGAGDTRRIHPRFQGDNLARNLALVEQMKAVADHLGLTSAQLALAWAVGQGDDVVPITGTQREKYLEQSVAATQHVLSLADRAELEAIFAPGARAGERYPLRMLPDLGI